MISLLLLLFLADPGGRPSDTCERKTGKAQCPTAERVYEGRWRCKASCYTETQDGMRKSDGGYFSTLIRAEGTSEAACKKTLDDMAARGCQ